MNSCAYYPSFSFLGITLHALTMDDLNRIINEAIKNNKQYVIGHHNLHSLYIYHHEPEMRAFYNRCHYVHIDGMILVLLGRLLGCPLKRIHRVTYIDWVRPLMREAAGNGWKVFFLGSKPGVAARAADKLKKEIKGLQLETMHGYFDAGARSKENQDVLKLIDDYHPHILLIGMGMPGQECWVKDNLGNVHANIILTAGACMDYVAGTINTPPRWAGRWGLEWLCRLLNEPVRLWRRYLLEPWFVLKLLVFEIMTK